MIDVSITLDDILLAKKKANETGKLKNSIYSGAGNIHGFLGEIVVANYINATIENTYDYDLIKNGIRIDVKTKSCKFKPNPDYDCSVYKLSAKQKCDYYVFVRILDDFSQGWILGGIRKTIFFKKAIFYKKGNIDPKSNFGWTFPADCYNLSISSLLKIVT